MTQLQQALAEADASVLNALLDAEHPHDPARPVNLGKATSLVGLTLGARTAGHETAAGDVLASDARLRWSSAILLGSLMHTRRGGDSNPACHSSDLDRPYSWWQETEQRAYAYAFAAALLLPVRILASVDPSEMASQAKVPAQVVHDRLNLPAGHLLEGASWPDKTYVLPDHPSKRWELV